MTLGTLLKTESFVSSPVSFVTYNIPISSYENDVEHLNLNTTLSLNLCNDGVNTKLLMLV
jgi:hypothetical protein